MNLRPKDYTAQEIHIQHLLDDFGLRCETQYSFIQYIVDFWVKEIGLVIEADGVYGHLSKRDEERDKDLLLMEDIEYIIHIKETTLGKIKEALWQELTKLG